MRGQALRDHLLNIATDLFYRDGFRATGVDAIVKAAGVAKRSLYNHFPSKDDLAAAVLRRRHAAFADRITAQLARRANDPAAKILAWFDVLGEELADPAYRGCIFFNAAIELGGVRQVRQAIDENNRFTHDLLVQLAAAAGADDAEAAALELGLLRRGAQMTAAVTGRPGAIEEAKRAAGRLLAGRAAPAAGAGEGPAGESRRIG